MEIFAKHSYARSSSQKVRLVADLIRRKKASQALVILSFIKKKAAIFLKKVLKSAISNAKHNYNIKEKNLKIYKVLINDGPVMKRTITRAKGRSNRILKRTSHITIILSDN